MGDPKYIVIRVPLIGGRTIEDVLRVFRDEAIKIDRARPFTDPDRATGKQRKILKNMRKGRRIIEYRWFLANPREVCVVLSTHTEYLIKEVKRAAKPADPNRDIYGVGALASGLMKEFGGEFTLSFTDEDQFDRSYRFKAQSEGDEL